MHAFAWLFSKGVTVWLQAETNITAREVLAKHFAIKEDQVLKISQGLNKASTNQNLFEVLAHISRTRYSYFYDLCLIYGIYILSLKRVSRNVLWIRPCRRRNPDS